MLARGILIALLTTAAVPALAASSIDVTVDATDARRGVFHSHVVMSATAGPFTFVYPKWIPGEHMPTGPLTQMAGLHVHAGGTELPWRRDPVEMFSFHVEVPAGASSVTVDFDYLSPSVTFGGGYGESANATRNLLTMPWNHVVVYPGGLASDATTCTASVRLPAGWKFDTALPVASQSAETISFAPVSLTTLVDSPLFAGAFVRTIPIAGQGAVKLTLVADSAPALALSDDRVAQLRNLVGETDTLFGARHYRTYTWLMALSDAIETQGLEHHESSDNRAPERVLIDSSLTQAYFSVLFHEFVHSWNGKFRRPSGLATRNYQDPMSGELLWVYEGMTRYLGDLLLTARSGMRTPEEDREFAAFVAANLDRNRPGRSWRPLADTAVSVQVIGSAPNEEVPYRRGLDYYDESMLIWLDADTLIRTKSNGTKSFDDFVRLFFGPPTSGPMVRPYTLDDVVSALNAVVPNDWRAFFQQRVYEVAPHPPLAALEAAGWKLVYNDVPNSYSKLRETRNKNVDLSLSLGFWIKDGAITDVVYGSPAYQAGFAPGMKIASVDGRKYSADVIREELHAARSGDQPIRFSIEQGTAAFPLEIAWRGGQVYPHLERLADRPDLLSEIIRSRRKPSVQ